MLRHFPLSFLPLAPGSYTLLISFSISFASVLTFFISFLPCPSSAATPEEPILAALLFFLPHYSFFVYDNLLSLREGFHHPTDRFP
jgi:hypothetical protein